MKKTDLKPFVSLTSFPGSNQRILGLGLESYPVFLGHQMPVPFKVFFLFISLNDKSFC